MPAAGPADSLVPLQAAVDEQVRHLDLRPLEEILAGLDDDVRERLPARSVRDVIVDPQGGLRLHPAELLRELRSEERRVGKEGRSRWTAKRDDNTLAIMR